MAQYDKNQSHHLETVASIGGDLKLLQSEIIGERVCEQMGTFDFTDPLEECIGKLWCESLGITSCSIDADFFELGGDSLIAVQLLGQIRKSTNAQVALADMLEGALTVRAVAAKVRAAQQ